MRPAGHVMPQRVSLFSALFLSATLVLAACGGSDDEPPPAPAVEEPAADAPAAAEQEATTPPTDTEDDAAPPQEQPAPATTPEERELIAYGEVVEATVESVEEARQFRFEGQAGDLVRIFVDGKDGMDPVTSLLEPNRTLILTNDDISQANRDSKIIGRLPSTGLQVIRVDAFNDASTGRFELRVSLLPEDPDVEDGTRLGVGDSFDGVLGEPDDTDFFEFLGEAGQALQIRVDGAIGVDTWVQLSAADGNVLQENDDGGHALDAELTVVLPEAGLYQLAVRAIDNKIGTYRLRIAAASAAPETDPLIQATVEAVALTYLSALQDGDSLILLDLAGPEALNIWGWETRDDVSRDVEKLRSIGVGGTAGPMETQVEAERALTTVGLTNIAGELIRQLRFDLSAVDGQWRVDYVQDVPLPTAGDSP